MSETKRLGRGLEALLGPVSRQAAEVGLDHYLGQRLEPIATTGNQNPYSATSRVWSGGKRIGFSRSI